MIYGYIRVSTDRQDCANQKLGIEAKAKSLGMCIEEYIQDNGVSGTREPESRALGGVLQQLKPGDVIICSELSRLGRKLFMIMRILEYCMQRGARLYTVKDNYELGDNIQSKVLAFAFGISAEIERDLISQRTKEALARRKLAGPPPGANPRQPEPALQTGTARTIYQKSAGQRHPPIQNCGKIARRAVDIATLYQAVLTSVKIVMSVVLTFAGFHPIIGTK